MAIKRTVDTKFWFDEKVIDDWSVEDKYFFLYLMTNPRTTQLGIYKIPKKMMSFETGYTKEVVEVLLQRFEINYKNILFNHQTQEVAVLNSLKYSIMKGGSPVISLLRKELAQVESADLIVKTYQHMFDWWNGSSRSFDKTVRLLFEDELQKRKISNYLINDNGNDNDKHNVNANGNGNDESGYDSGYDSQQPHEINVPYQNTKIETNPYQLYQECFGMLNSINQQDIAYWIEDLSEELVIEAMKKAVLNGKPYSYAKGILKQWADKGIKTTEQAKAEEVQFNNNRFNRKPIRKEPLPDWANEEQVDEPEDVEMQRKMAQRLADYEARKASAK